MTAYTYQVVIYGATPGGCMAAIASAMAGASTALIADPAPGFTTSHVGGMMSNGLGATDAGKNFGHIVGTGPTGMFFQRNAGRYGSVIPISALEPHAAELLFKFMLAQAGVDVFGGKYLSGATLSGTTITQISVTDGTNVDTFSATNFADGSYEGDLAAAAGVTMNVGREANNYFQITAPAGSPGAPAGPQWLQNAEPIGGFNPSSLFGYPNFVNANPYASGGGLLPLVSALPATPIGGADSRVPAYGFRVCMSQRKDNIIPFSQPVAAHGLSGFDPSLVALQYEQIGSTSTFSLGSLVNGKFDANYDYPTYDADSTGGPAAWPTASWSNRALISYQMYVQQMGYYWYGANNASVPDAYAAGLNTYGLAADEFRDNTYHTPGWPRLPYIRNARRMYGQYVMTQYDIQTAITKPDSVSMATYNVDCHPCGYYASGSGYLFDSNSSVPLANKSVAAPYQVPLRAALPLVTQCVNLAVICAASFSHVAMCSFRIEHQWMNFGVGVGTALGMSSANSEPMQYYVTGAGLTALQSALTGMGQVLSYTP